MILCANPSAQFLNYQSEIESAILSVVRSNSYILGKEVSMLEKEFSEFIGSKYSVGVANGTDAIELALRALNIGLGDEVITVSHTAVATISAIEATGAEAVLVDVDPDTYTLNHHQLDEVYSKKTKAIIAVHLYGHSADMDSISDFCSRFNLFLIEDASQAHGAKYKGERLGNIGDIGCFSCYPTKNLGAIGDAGLITTNSFNISKKIRMLREYGWKNRISEIPGRNSRLDELQAAILRVKLKYLDDDNQKRIDIANLYLNELADLPIKMPSLDSSINSVFHLFVIQAKDRDKIIEYLKKNSIQAGIHYPVPVHLQKAYKGIVKTSKDMGCSENLAKNIISLPIYPQLENYEVKKIIDVLRNFFN